MVRSLNFSLKQRGVIERFLSSVERAVKPDHVSSLEDHSARDISLEVVRPDPRRPVVSNCSRSDDK